MQQLLKTHFGYDEFRPHQEEIINAIVSGEDALVVMPTGGGKSLCYQLPALYFDGITIVVSPLISLMKDQVDALRANGIAAEFINSSLDQGVVAEIMARARGGKIKMLYLAPERLASVAFQGFLQSLRISLVAIDEAHCISEWGHEFRPNYRTLSLLKRWFPCVPLVALTATATPRVRDDIVAALSLADPKIFVTGFDRENLMLRVEKKRRSYEKLLALVRRHKDESVIVYCFSRKEADRIAADLSKDGLRAVSYHAGLDGATRQKHQDLFIKDEVSIVVATIAFGMGIDKPDVRLVVHYSFPKTLEGYYQEIGRAGRDGLPGECVLFYSSGDRCKHEFFLDNMENVEEQAHMRQKLDHVMRYCESHDCRRKQLLGYFGEEYARASNEGCAACDNCGRERQEVDATELAQKIISCVVRTGGRFGKGYIIDVLKGKRTEQVGRNGHDALSVFGIAQDCTRDGVREVIDALITQKLLHVAGGKFPTLTLAKKGVRFLKNKESFAIMRFVTTISDGEEDAPSPQPLDFDAGLFEELRVLRKRIADVRHVPPFIIFGDVSLREMAAYVPRDEEGFSRITGVGEKKRKDFGEAFLACIKAYAARHQPAVKEAS